MNCCCFKPIKEIETKTNSYHTSNEAKPNKQNKKIPHLDLSNIREQNINPSSLILSSDSNLLSPEQPKLYSISMLKPNEQKRVDEIQKKTNKIIVTSIKKIDPNEEPEVNSDKSHEPNVEPIKYFEENDDNWSSYTGQTPILNPRTILYFTPQQENTSTITHTLYGEVTATR